MKENKDNFVIRAHHIKSPEAISDSNFNIFENNCNNWIKTIESNTIELKRELGYELSSYRFYSPILSNDRTIATFSFGGIANYLNMKFFEDVFPAELLNDFSIIFKLNLVVGYTNPSIFEQTIWNSLYSDREKESIKRYSQITGDDDRSKIRQYPHTIANQS
jgi:hypothetical protein